MSARYYPTAKSGERLGPPLPSYSAAREWHAQSVMCGASAEGRVVLLDLSSLPLDDETAWKRLLNDDPVIAAIFHMGFALGYDWDGDHDENGDPVGQSPEWLRDRYRAEARAVLDAALDGAE